MTEDYTNYILAVQNEVHGYVLDDDEAIVVNTDTRDFTLGNVPTLIGLVGDHNSNMVSFKFPKTIDRHVIAECANKYVIWRNKETKKTGKFNIKVVTETVDNNILFGWLISNEVTQDVGEIEYCVKLSDYDENGNLIYKWNSKWGDGLFIEDGYVDNDAEYVNEIKKDCTYLVDRETGILHQIYVFNGKLVIEEVTEENQEV